MLGIIQRIIVKGFFSGVGFGVGLVVILGLYFFVQAVAPGAVKNPTFGPTDDDVTFLSQAVLFNQADRVNVFNSASCADGTNSKWITVDVSAKVPAGTTMAIVQGLCVENNMYVRPFGSSLDPLTNNTETRVCLTGNGDADGIVMYVGLQSGKFETFNGGTDCDSRRATIDLIGYIQ